MSFYGLPRNRLGEVVDHLTAVRDIYETAGKTVFAADNMVALGRNLSFLTDERFSRAIQENAAGDDDLNKIWRIHTYCWAARSALSLPGDFVECGVYRGFYSATMLAYLDFEAVKKQMYLYDSFEGLSDSFSDGSEREVVGNAYDDVENWYEDVLGRFAPYPNVHVIKGVVPNILMVRSPEQVAFLHLDMNAAAAEVTALEALWDRIGDGGFILLDDYGRNENIMINVTLRKWLAERDHCILELPTGQGLVIRRHDGNA